MVSREVVEHAVRDDGKVLGEVQRCGNYEEGEEKEESLVLFACRHLWHRGCLERAGSAVGQEQSAEGGNAEVGKMMGRMGLKCPLC